MCWCLKVFFRALANLTGRMASDVMDVVYRTSCCCCGAGMDLEEKGLAERETEEERREEFFQSVGRRSVELLLENRQNGTFIIRPSKYSNLGTLSVVQDGKVFHLRIRRREDGMISLGREKIDEKCFASLDSMINYYISNYLVVYSNGEEALTLLLPYRTSKAQNR